MCGIRTSPGNSYLWLNEDQDPARPDQKLSLAVVRHEGNPPILRLQAWKRENQMLIERDKAWLEKLRGSQYKGRLLG